MTEVREQMMKMAANDAKEYANELYGLKKEREQLVKELALKGECDISNKQVQNLDDVIEEAKTALEMAVQTFKSYYDEDQNKEQPLNVVAFLYIAGGSIMREHKTKKGKYHDWVTPEGLTLIQGWARSGLSNEQIAENIGINQATLYTWVKKHNEINEAIKKGKEVSDYEVENAMYKSAIGYEVEEVKTFIEKTEDGKEKKKIERTTKHIAPNVTAQIFWLKNRKPDEWKDRTEQKINANVTSNKLDDILKQLDDQS